MNSIIQSENFKQGDRFIVQMSYGRKKSASVEIRLLKRFILKAEPTWDADVVSVDGVAPRKPKTLYNFTDEFLSNIQKLNKQGENNA